MVDQRRITGVDRWDIFCTVIDNYGDVAVSWRLARQLAGEHGLQVRLWVDDLAPLSQLRPGVDADSACQQVDGVELRRWSAAFPAVDVADVTDVVIEAFGCTVPESYVVAMSARPAPPVWINLEYLSAEAWVDGAHGLASPHPRLPLTKYFFFPGFTPKSGGLLREADYATRTNALDDAGFRAALSLPPRHQDELTVSLFGYENDALPGLLDAWANSPSPIVCLVPEGRLIQVVHEFFGHGDAPLHRGHLTTHIIPFLPQDDYDTLLACCDLNFVRGEDSFVRAQWAAKPFVWHIYPQDEGTHLVKLESFLQRYQSGLPAPEDKALHDFWMAWNDAGDAGAEWPALAEALPGLAAHTAVWTKTLCKRRDLATNLLDFARQKAKN